MMRRVLSVQFALAIIFGSSLSVAETKELALTGKQVFSRCQACHDIEPGLHIFGPSLAGIVGRDVGSIADYSYSSSLQEMNFAWTPDKLQELLSAPAQNMLPGTKMIFPGFTDEDKVKALIAYLKTI